MERLLYNIGTEQRYHLTRMQELSGQTLESNRSVVHIKNRFAYKSHYTNGAFDGMNFAQ